MLSNFILPTQKFVLIIDEIRQEKLAEVIISKLLREQGQDAGTIKSLKLSPALENTFKFDEFVKECSSNSKEDGSQWNVLLPPLSDLYCYQRPTELFHFIHQLKKCPLVRQIFLWCSTHHLPVADRHFLLACFEYISDLVLYLQSLTELAIVTRKPGGGVTNRSYTYKRSRNEFQVVPSQKGPELMQSRELTKAQPEPAAKTFKIELEEEELVARNALTLPYEKTSEDNEGRIVYTPDAQDDFDDEDPDEDLCI